jgi:hypothetical protein
MVSRFDKRCERAERKSRPEAGVESKIVFGFCARDVTLRIVEPATDDYVGLCVRAGKRKQQIAKRCYDTKVRRSRTTDRSSTVYEFVVDPIEPYPNWELSHPNGQDDHPVIARTLGVAQFADRDCAASTRTQRVRFLARCQGGKNQGADQKDW